jgi:multimeric flavodoxin WrbA
MKAMILYGSPNRQGNSATLAKYFCDGLKRSGLEEIYHFYTNEMNIGTCQMCMTCKTSEGNCCLIQDDMSEIIEAFKKSNIVVFATPMFWGYMTAQLKIVLDRMESLCVGPSKWWVGKHFVGIFTYWHHYESMVSFFERITPHFGVQFEKVLYCSKSNDPSIDDVHVSTNEAKCNEAFELGKSLAIT